MVSNLCFIVSVYGKGINKHIENQGFEFLRINSSCIFCDTMIGWIELIDW